MASENLRELTDDNFDNEVLQNEQPVLVDFWAPWCGPCRMVGPVIEELADDYAGKIKVGKLNIDENPNFTQKYDIRTIPTVMLFKGGQPIESTIGAVPKSEFETMINKGL